MKRLVLILVTLVFAVSLNAAAKDWKVWIVQYSKFVDNYVAVIKKGDKGDAAAKKDAKKLAGEYAKLQMDYPFVLAGVKNKAEAADFTKQYTKASAKVTTILKK